MKDQLTISYEVMLLRRRRYYITSNLEAANACHPQDHEICVNLRASLEEVDQELARIEAAHPGSTSGPDKFVR